METSKQVAKSHYSQSHKLGEFLVSQFAYKTEYRWVLLTNDRTESRRWREARLEKTQGKTSGPLGGDLTQATPGKLVHGASYADESARTDDSVDGLCRSRHSTADDRYDVACEEEIASAKDVTEPTDQR